MGALWGADDDDMVGLDCFDWLEAGGLCDDLFAAGDLFPVPEAATEDEDGGATMGAGRDTTTAGIAAISAVDVAAAADDGDGDDDEGIADTTESGGAALVSLLPSPLIGPTSTAES
jgi:hypothetical protein